MARKTESMLTAASTLALALSVVDKKKLTFTAKVGADDLCDFTGKVKKYRDVDTVVNALLKANPSMDEVVVTIDTEGVRVPKIPSDPVAAATAEKLRLTSQKTAVTATRAKLTGQLTAIAAYASGNPSQVLYFNELTLQKTTCDALVADIDAKIAIQDAIITPGP
jgi:hypothetical protein